MIVDVAPRKHSEAFIGHTHATVGTAVVCPRCSQRSGGELVHAEGVNV